MRRGVIVMVALVSAAARGQSSELIDAVRVHRSGLAAQAKEELDACVAGQPAPDAGVKKPKKPCAEAARLALLWGYLELSEGDATAAAKTLAASKPPKGLEAFHGWYLGEALAWSGDKPAAVKVLTRAKKTAPTWLAKRIDLRLAELWLALGQAAKAKPIFEAEDDPSPELIYSRALARKATGDADKARADLRLIYLRFPTHPHAELARLALGDKLTLTFDESLTRALALLAAGEATQALTQLDAVPPPDAKKARVALVRGQALLMKGKDEDGFAQLEVALAGPPAVAAEALATKAKRLMRVSDNAKARELFAKLDTKYPSDVNADEAGYFAAWLAMNSGELDTAVQAFGAFEQRHPSSRKRDEARWFKAYSQFRLKRYPAMRDTLLALETDFPRSSLVPQAKYWAARAAQLTPEPDAGRSGDAGTKPDATAEYASVIAAFPGSFYALLSSERLRDLGVDPAPPFSERPKQLTPKTPPALALAIELGKAGLLRDEAEEVQRAISAVGAADAMTWGHALQGLGEFGAAYTLAARYLWGAAYTARQPEALALMYPRAYRASVERASKENGLDPFLAWAIMRRESAFKPEVTSIADARGLLQLIPPTARSIAAELKIDPPAPDELYSPERNIQLATWYLAALRDRLGHESLAAAAYNAGASPVFKWVKERPDVPLDQWVEEIPWKETRAYVKQVTADYYLYQRLYGDPPGRLPMTLPVPKATGVNF